MTIEVVTQKGAGGEKVMWAVEENSTFIHQIGAY